MHVVILTTFKAVFVRRLIRIFGVTFLWVSQPTVPGISVEFGRMGFGKGCQHDGVGTC